MRILKNVILAIAAMCTSAATFSAALSVNIPPDFHLASSAPGVALYRKDYPGGNPDFVQVVNLAQGASVTLLHGNITEAGKGRGVYGGDDPQMTRQSLGQFWDEFSASNSGAFCVTNGQFFVDKADYTQPTSLAFPLKKDGHIVSDGYGIGEYPNQKLMLEIWADRADITPLTKDALYSSSAPNIIAGLTQDANKNPNKSTGRTFVGVDDGDNDGRYETVLIFNSKTATQPGAASVLTDFGADKIVMLDGGGSTQLICQGTSHIPSSRPIPQVLAVASKPLPEYDAAVVDQSNFTILEPGQSSTLYVEMKNAGRQAWIPGQGIQLVRVGGEAMGSRTTLDLPGNVLPGQSGRWELAVTAPGRAGLYQATWQLRQGSDAIGQAVTLNVIVLPPEAKELREELERRIEEWRKQGEQKVEELIAQITEEITKYLEREVEKSIKSICPTSAVIAVLACVMWLSRRR